MLQFLLTKFCVSLYPTGDTGTEFTRNIYFSSGKAHGKMLRTCMGDMGDAFSSIFIGRVHGQLMIESGHHSLCYMSELQSYRKETQHFLSCLSFGEWCIIYLKK